MSRLHNGDASTVASGLIVAAPSAADFADGVARRNWEIALPRLWSTYYEVCRKFAVSGVDGLSRRNLIGDDPDVVAVELGREFDDGGRGEGCGMDVSEGVGVVVGGDVRECGRVAVVGCVDSVRQAVSDGEGLGGCVEGQVDGVSDAAGALGTEADGVSRLVSGRGKNYAKNKAARMAKRAKARAVAEQGVESSSWRGKSGDSGYASSGSVGGAGKCWTVREESDMERRIREALEKKKAVEAELAARKAELALGRMNDKVLTDLYDIRVKQEGICRMNQAVVKSEKSLEGLKSVNPGSSATPGEIREALLNSESWKLKESKIRAWLAAGSPAGGLVDILDGADNGSMDSYLQLLALEGQDEVERQEAIAREWKNAYLTKDEIAAREAKLADRYSIRVVGKVVGERDKKEPKSVEDREYQVALAKYDANLDKLKQLEVEMSRGG